MSQKKLALSLRGGAARAAGSWGVLQALDELGIKVDMLCGSSMGAIIAASYASHISLDKVIELTKGLSLRSLINLESLHDISLLGDDTFLQLLDKAFDDKALQDLDIPVFIQATDITNFTSVYFEQGPLKLMLLASSAFPFLTVPVEINDKMYIDGDITAGYGADFLRSKGAEVVIGLSGGIQGMEFDHTKPLGRFMDPLTAGMQRIKELDLALNPLDMLITNLAGDAGSFDFDHAQAMIDSAYARIMGMQDQIRELVF